MSVLNDAWSNDGANPLILLAVPPVAPLIKDQPSRAPGEGGHPGFRATTGTSGCASELWTSPRKIFFTTPGASRHEQA